MNNRKGFTLVEVIAVVVILGVILMIAVPSITGLSNRSKEKRMIEDAKMFITLVQSKIESDTSIYPTEGSKFYLSYIDTKNLTESPYGFEYNPDKSNVAVSNCNEETYICGTYEVYLTDGKKIATGTIDDITVSDVE